VQIENELPSYLGGRGCSPPNGVPPGISSRPSAIRRTTLRLPANGMGLTLCGDEPPILLRAESNARHSASKPLTKRAAGAADRLGFIGWQLDVTRA